MVEQHLHTWVRDKPAEPMKCGLIRAEETCACGATRVRIGYGFSKRRR